MAMTGGAGAGGVGGRMRFFSFAVFCEAPKLRVCPSLQNLQTCKPFVFAHATVIFLACLWEVSSGAKGKADWNKGY